VKLGAGTNDTIPETKSTEYWPSAVTRDVAEQIGATSTGKHSITDEAMRVVFVAAAGESLDTTFTNWVAPARPEEKSGRAVGAVIVIVIVESTTTPFPSATM
jgi:hypothetical protein